MRAAHLLSFEVAGLAVVTLALMVSAIACVREGAPVVAPLEIDTGDAGPTAALVIVPAPVPVQREQCTARLRAAPISTGAGCTLDERISHGNGALVYPCTGDGPVEAVFGEHRFVGKMTDTDLVLALTTELDWDDGCHWETQQGIRGKLRRQGKPKLLWSYTESPVRGSSCFGSCKATAEIEVDELDR